MTRAVATHAQAALIAIGMVWIRKPDAGTFPVMSHLVSNTASASICRKKTWFQPFG
jgi:hypothetical protein